MAWPPERIERAGVELEGGWENQPPFRVHGDGSVSVVAPIVGEISSDPMEPVRLIEWMKTPGIYPDVVNPSCGMHVHISMLSNMDYARLTKEDFYREFLAAMKTWGEARKVRPGSEFWKRLRGENRYCMAQFIPEQQIAGTGGTRYTQLNYPYGEHGTIECRMLTLFKRKDIARDAIQSYITFVDDFLLAARAKKEKIFAVRQSFAFKAA